MFNTTFSSEFGPSALPAPQEIILILINQTRSALQSPHRFRFPSWKCWKDLVWLREDFGVGQWRVLFQRGSMKEVKERTTTRTTIMSLMKEGRKAEEERELALHSLQRSINGPESSPRSSALLLRSNSTSFQSGTPHWAFIVVHTIVWREERLDFVAFPRKILKFQNLLNLQFLRSAPDGRLSGPRPVRCSFTEWGKIRATAPIECGVEWMSSCSFTSLKCYPQALQ